MSLIGKVCVVTGASRGIGKGIALQLGKAGAKVYVTGRTLTPNSTDRASSVGGSLQETADEISARGGIGIAVVCDHSKDSDVLALFERIHNENDGKLDLLVNNAYSAVNALLNNIGKPFWESGIELWDQVNHVGLRNCFLCTVEATKLMVKNKDGLIINISSFGGLNYFLSVQYGVGKEAVDRLAVDSAIELRPYGVSCISLWPGPVKTEEIMSAMPGADSVMRSLFLEGETPEFSGICVVKLLELSNKERLRISGRTLFTSEIARNYGFSDVDGRSIPSRSLKNYFQLYYPSLAWLIPGFIRVPHFVIWLMSNRLG